MHDGYLFTLGVCGSASAASPATAILDAMLAALPPVKRAAYLGEIVPLDALGTQHDELVQNAVADMADAEILLLVTPTYRGSPAQRFSSLLSAMSHRYGANGLPHSIAVLVTIGEEASAPSLVRAIPAGVALLQHLHLPVATPDSAMAVALAR
ncbi:hypothetical protein HC891_28240, partial [Candidatus Gracilibacteria bacterium]|nr:hypothetical protein [Candidatus Gracilibacteria bacterium]